MRFLIPIALLFLLAACNKDKGFTKAMVINTGNISTTGCGYLLRLEDGYDEKPDYLPSAYQHDSLKVLVKMSSTGTQSNCIPGQPYDIVTVEDIKRDL